MKKWFQYNLEDQVVSYSKEKCVLPDNILQIELKITDEEYEKMQKNYKLFIRNGKLEMEETLDIKKKNIFEKLKKPHLKTEELQNLLLELLT